MHTLITLEPFKIFRIGLGTNRITDTNKAHDLLRFARDQGINFFDTANIYQDGESEKGIASALYPYRKDLCIATKGGFVKTADSYVPEGHPEKLKKNLHESLKRLRLERIDLYTLHRIDPNVPLKESLGMLKELQNEGLINHIGLSEVTVAQVKEAQAIIKVASVQNHFNIVSREHEPVLDYCDENKIIFIPFFPLGSARHSFSKSAIDTLSLIAKQYGNTPSQVALAWLLQRSPYMLPIPGTLSKEHVRENIESKSLNLSREDLSKIDLLK
jgi:pyridoxine 4-dehydrogenase